MDFHLCSPTDSSQDIEYRLVDLFQRQPFRDNPNKLSHRVVERVPKFHHQVLGEVDKVFAFGLLVRRPGANFLLPLFPDLRVCFEFEPLALDILMNQIRLPFADLAEPMTPLLEIDLVHINFMVGAGIAHSSEASLALVLAFSEGELPGAYFAGLRFAPLPGGKALFISV